MFRRIESLIEGSLALCTALSPIIGYDKAAKIAQHTFEGHMRDYGKTPVKRACYASDRTGRFILDTLFEQCVKAKVRFYDALSIAFQKGLPWLGVLAWVVGRN